MVKGNGYGFGVGRLARKAEWLGCDTLAVGTYEASPRGDEALRRPPAGPPHLEVSTASTSLRPSHPSV